LRPPAAINLPPIMKRGDHSPSRFLAAGPSKSSVEFSVDAT